MHSLTNSSCVSYRPAGRSTPAHAQHSSVWERPGRQPARRPPRHCAIARNDDVQMQPVRVGTVQWRAAAPGADTPQSHKDCQRCRQKSCGSINKHYKTSFVYNSNSLKRISYTYLAIMSLFQVFTSETCVNLTKGQAKLSLRYRFPVDLRA
jgi:hypothetical protein